MEFVVFGGFLWVFYCLIVFLLCVGFEVLIDVSVCDEMLMLKFVNVVCLVFVCVVVWVSVFDVWEIIVCGGCV